MWTSRNLFHVAWQGSSEAWVQDPLHVRPIAHTIWDPYFGQSTIEALTRGGALGPVNDFELKEENNTYDINSLKW